MPRRLVVQKKGGRRPRSKSPTKRARSPKRRTTQLSWAPGTYGHYETEATMAYIQSIRKTFKNDHSVFQQFLKILSEVKTPEANVVDIIDRVVRLFDGYPDLLYSFNAFLPRNHEIEVQGDAVVVKVYEDDNTSNKVIPTKGAPRKEYTDAMNYIQDVKDTLSYDTKLYQEFMEILFDFHNEKVKEVMTVRRMVKLLQGHPHLVLGFNEFLPPGHHIHMYNDSQYTVQYPSSKGNPVTVTISTG